MQNWLSSLEKTPFHYCHCCLRVRVRSGRLAARWQCKSCFVSRCRTAYPRIGSLPWAAKSQFLLLDRGCELPDLVVHAAITWCLLLRGLFCSLPFAFQLATNCRDDYAKSNWNLRMTVSSFESTYDSFSVSNTSCFCGSDLLPGHVPENRFALHV